MSVFPEDRLLAQRVYKIASRADSRFGISAFHIESGRKLTWRENDMFESGSAIKIAVLAEVLSRRQEGTVTLDERLRLTHEMKAAGSGVLDALSPGLQPTKLDLLRLMIIVSDNTAANYWIDQCGTDAINKRMELLGLREIRLTGRIPNIKPGEKDSKVWEGLKLGEATPHALSEYFRLLAAGKLFGKEATALAHEIFSQQHFKRISKRLLSGSGRTWEGKTGSLGHTVLDCGLLTTPKGRFVLAIIADQIPGREGGEDTAVNAIGDIAYEIVSTWEETLPVLEPLCP
jgi:beta-lactamase class A